MKQICIQKTDTGYILRPSVANRAGYSLLAALLVALGCCTLIFAVPLPLAIVGGGLLIGLGLLLLLAPFRRVVMDENGVYMYRLGHLSRSISWSEVKAWGIITQSMGRSYYRRNISYLYFSPVKGQTTGRRSIFMEISPKDEAEIAASRIKKYIRKHLAEDDK